jgi:hypothetical protein
MTTLNYLRDDSVTDISQTIAYVESNNGYGYWRSISCALEAAADSSGSASCAAPQLCDDFLYDGVMPSFESVFAGRRYQRSFHLPFIFLFRFSS